MDVVRHGVAGLALLLALVVGCATRGPVDRSVEGVHATNRTVGESAETVTESTGNVVVDAITFPFRLVGRVFGALFG
jgi:predicted nucleotidyltransferase